MVDEINYRGFLEKRLVGWLKGFWGSRFMYTTGLVLDGLMEGVKNATLSRFIEYAPDDALPYAGADANLERYAPDTDDTYRARIKIRFPTWESAGTKRGWETEDLGLLGQLKAFGFENAYIYEPIDWAPGAADWSRFWVVLGMPHPYTWAKWGSMVWGSFTWGFLDAFGVPIALDEALRRLVRKWKPAHVRCEKIIILSDPDTPVWGHTTMTWGSFTWGTGSVAEFSG